ncbi:hypothetical protein N2152v2_009700 [Parachlorella kessleri]
MLGYEPGQQVDVPRMLRALPADAPIHPGVELFEVPDVDPRAEHLPVGKGLRATQNIPEGTCVGFYSGTIYSEEGFQEMLRVIRGPERLRTIREYSMYDADLSPPDGGYAEGTGTVIHMTVLFVSAAEVKGEMARLNDPNINPMSSEGLDEYDDTLGNCKLCTVLVGPCACLAVCTSEDVKKGKELTTCYGKKWWQAMADHQIDADNEERVEQQWKKRVDELMARVQELEMELVALRAQGAGDIAASSKPPPRAAPAAAAKAAAGAAGACAAAAAATSAAATPGGGTATARPASIPKNSSRHAADDKPVHLQPKAQDQHPQSSPREMHAAQDGCLRLSGPSPAPPSNSSPQTQQPAAAAPRPGPAAHKAATGAAAGAAAAPKGTAALAAAGKGKAKDLEPVPAKRRRVEAPADASAPDMGHRSRQGCRKKVRLGSPSCQWITVYNQYQPMQEQCYYNLSSHQVDEDVAEGFGDGLYISSMCACGELWAIIMDAGTGFSKQVYKVTQRSSLPKEWISKQADKGFFITAIAGSAAKSWLVVMSKGTKLMQQRYKASDSFPWEWIKEKWRKKYHVTALATRGTQWAVVMSRGARYLNQALKLDSQYPSKSIRKWWGAGFYITACAAAPEQAAFVLSKSRGTEADERQETLRTTAFPSERLDEKWDKDLYITGIAYGRTVT